MHADAQTPHQKTHEPSPAPDLTPCRFCGETQKLVVGEGLAENQLLFAADLNPVRAETGQPFDFADDNVWCQVCDAMAPRQVWEASPEKNSAMRAVTLVVWEEYSDEDGSWIGARQ